MSKHTFERLILREDVYCDAVEVTDENGFKVVDVPGTPILLQWRELLGIAHWADDPRASMELSQEQQAANVRRIVACVNACAGIRTEALELRVHMLQAGDDEIAALRQQRDKLLAALKSAKHMLERDYIDDAKMAVIEKCDAAIEAVEGGA